MAAIEVPVLIAGGGPVGLTAAVLLARHGVRSLLVERNPSTTDHPKARGVNTRTMELLRPLGIDERIAAQGLPPGCRRFIWVATLAGAEIGRVEDPRGNRPGSYSPVANCNTAQDVVEAELRARAEQEEPATLRFGTTLAGFEQDEAGVTARLVDASGAEMAVRARYLIAADGASSPVRRALGVAMVGPEPVNHQINIHFRADLTPWVAHRPSVGFISGEGHGTLLWAHGTDRWLLLGAYHPERGEDRDSFTDARCIELVRRAVGVPDLPVEVINLAFWALTAQVAARFREGNVFLAGDAAHRFPPTGGFGMNTGMQDVHNLAWKLAGVLQGWAAPDLLDSYDAERRPTAQANTDFSVRYGDRWGEVVRAIRSGDRWAIEAALIAQRPHLESEGQDLGFWYESAGIIPDGSDPPTGSSREYVPTARPGSRAPHVWLERDVRRISTLDLFDRRFALLAGEAGSAWRDAALNSADQLGLPLDAWSVGVGGDLSDPAAAWQAAYGVGADGAVLVRPDGHVAWRSSGPDEIPARVLERVCRAVVARQERVSAA